MKYLVQKPNPKKVMKTILRFTEEFQKLTLKCKTPCRKFWDSFFSLCLKMQKSMWSLIMLTVYFLFLLACLPYLFFQLVHRGVKTCCLFSLFQCIFHLARRLSPLFLSDFIYLSMQIFASLIWILMYEWRKSSSPSSFPYPFNFLPISMKALIDHIMHNYSTPKN